MFRIKLKDGTFFNATAVEESFRVESNGESYITLTIQNDDANAEDSLETYKNRFTADNIDVITVYDESSSKIIFTYTGYIYTRYLTSRIQVSGNILYDFNFMKIDPLSI